MTSKTNLLGKILGSLNDDENQMIEKIATNDNSIINTETPGTGKKAPVQASSSAEKKLSSVGLAGLQKELFHEVPTVSGAKKDGGLTGNGEQMPKKVEPGTTFEKKASSAILSDLFKQAGIEGQDLEKNASTQEENGLLKIAFDTIEEMNDLEKVADDMAERAADKFLDILAKRG